MSLMSLITSLRAMIERVPATLPDEAICLCCERAFREHTPEGDGRSAIAARIA